MRQYVNTAIVFLCLGTGIPVAAEEFDLATAIRKLNDYYPTLKIAQLKAQQASWEIENVKSRLSWGLNGSVGLSHDVSAFNTPYDRFDASANISRKLESGHTMGISGRYQYNDDSFVINNSFPNPSQSLNLDLNYRIPLGRGENNTGYKQSLTVAGLQERVEQLNEKAILKSLIEQVINLFYEIDNTEQRLVYTESSIRRSQRLKDYIYRNKEIGIYEKKDLLESDAQLLKVIADRESLRLAVSEQKHALRKLMGIDSNLPVSLVIGDAPSADLTSDELLVAAENDYPQLHIRKRLLEISDANIVAALDENSDQKDIVFSVGARSLYGDSETENVSEEDYAAQLRFEYNYDLGEKSYTSRIEKIKKEKDIALQEIRLNKDDIKYQLNALLDKINKQEVVLKRLTQHKKSSQDKFDEANQRYRKGRIDTTDLIKFENDLHIANLDFSSAKTNLSHSKMKLALLTGSLWKVLGMNELAGIR